MREVFNLFSFDSVVQVKRSCYFTDYQFRPTTSTGLYNVIGKSINIIHYIIFSQKPELNDKEECKELDRFLVKGSV